jgi:hypothetical protein
MFPEDLLGGCRHAAQRTRPILRVAVHDSVSGPWTERLPTWPLVVPSPACGRGRSRIRCAPAGVRVYSPPVIPRVPAHTTRPYEGGFAPSRHHGSMGWKGKACAA